MLIEAIQGRGGLREPCCWWVSGAGVRVRMTRTCVRAEGRADDAGTGTLVHLVVAG